MKLEYLHYVGAASSLSYILHVKKFSSLKSHVSFSQPLETIEEPRFEHCIFDAFGTSPLVLHFLERQQLVTNNGYSCLLQRTEISYVPPRDSPTYHHVLNASRSKSSETSKQFMRSANYYMYLCLLVHGLRLFKFSVIFL